MYTFVSSRNLELSQKVAAWERHGGDLLAISEFLSIAFEFGQELVVDVAAVEILERNDAFRGFDFRRDVRSFAEDAVQCGGAKRRFTRLRIRFYAENKYFVLT